MEGFYDICEEGLDVSSEQYEFRVMSEEWKHTGLAQNARGPTFRWTWT